MSGDDGSMNKIKKAINVLSPELKKKHEEALAEGYKDKVCSKCNRVFLAHHHFVNCILAHSGECPMVATGEKSLLKKLLK